MKSAPINTNHIPRPSMMRRLWIPGIQYEHETDAQMDAREKACREEDAAIEAEIDRLWAWKCRPWWET